MLHSTRPKKPRKPRPDFPLLPHAAGVWAKKIRGRIHYFGKWADHQVALEKYLAEKDDLQGGSSKPVSMIVERGKDLIEDAGVDQPIVPRNIGVPFSCREGRFPAERPSGSKRQG